MPRAAASAPAATSSASAQDVEGHEAAARAFFFDEYRLNHLEYTYPKPGVAFMDGVTMGGGVGIACPCRYRVATERTVLAMPETTIGIFPDVGGGRYLSRLRGRLAQFLALTGARLDGAECLKLRLATHYLPSDRLDEAKERIMAQPFRVQAILDELAEENVPEARIAGNLAQDRPLLRLRPARGHPRRARRRRRRGRRMGRDRGGDDPQEVADRVQGQPQAAQSKAPTSSTSSTRCGWNMASWCASSATPISARACARLLVDKDNAPHWSPATPEEISDADIERFFEPLPEDEAWTPYPLENGA